MTDKINTHGVTLTFGKHSGELITRVPVSYLKFMLNNRTIQWEYAETELERRGAVTPEVEISGHAIDRASLRCRKIWHETSKDDNEGLHAWLVRVSTEALKDDDKSEIIYYLGLKLVFERNPVWPVLKTIMPKMGKP